MIELLQTQLNQRIKKDVTTVEKIMNRALKIYDLKKSKG